MKRVISISEVVETLEADGGLHEVCATAEASYDEEKSVVIVQLDCFLRPADARQKLPTEPHDWLPRKCTIIEAVPRDEAPLLTREIFQTWVRKVRRTIPTVVHT